MLSPQVFVGIDVATAQLDMALRPIGTRWTVSHDDAGITDLVTRIQGLGPQLIVLEATGGYQRAVVAALAAAALPVVVVNPRQARDVAKATGQVAQTDALDARALAHVAEAIRPRPALSPMRRPRSYAPCWHGGGNSSPCGRQSITASGMRHAASRPISRPISRGSMRA